MGLLIKRQVVQEPETFIYVPSVYEEITYRVDMQRGCWKFNDFQILDKNNNGLCFPVIIVGTADWYGQIGRLDYATTWTKMLFIPLFTEKENVYAPLKPSVCSVYLRGESNKLWVSIKQLAPTMGFDLGSCVLESSFGNVAKPYQNKQTGEAGIGNCRPLELKPVKAEKPEHIKILTKLQEEIEILAPKLELLLHSNSGHNILPTATIRQTAALESTREPLMLGEGDKFDNLKPHPAYGEEAPY